MSGARERPSLEELGAYLDGELGGDRHAAVEEHLGGSPEDAGRIAAYRRLDAALRQGFAAEAGRVRPEAVLRAAQMRAARVRRAVAAAIVLVLLTGGSAWWLHRTGRGPDDLTTLARDASLAYRIHPVASEAASSHGLVPGPALGTWLATTIGEAAWAPDLERFGFRPTGEALLSTGREPMAQITYADAAGRRISCFFWRRPVSADVDLRYLEDQGVVTAYGADGGLGYAMAGQMGRRELEAIAETVYRGREGRE